MSEKVNGKVVADTPAAGVNAASEEEDDWGKVVDTEIAAVDCVDELIPGARTEMLGDEWAYDVWMGDEIIGTVYLSNRDNSICTYDEICEQVRKIKAKWLSAQG